MGLRRRRAREVARGGGGHPRVRFRDSTERGVAEVAVAGSLRGSFIGPRQGMGSRPYMVRYLVIGGYGVGPLILLFPA